MSEQVTSTFRCDFCGTASEPELVEWVRPRCSVELVLRGRRFLSVRPRSAGDIPTDPGPILSEEDERWSSELCDRCMKRVAALFDVKLETEEEHRVRLAQEHQENLARARSSRGELVNMFPTPSATSSPVQPEGGFMAQTPTDPSHLHLEVPVPFVPAHPVKAKRARGGKTYSSSSKRKRSS